MEEGLIPRYKYKNVITKQIIFSVIRIHKNTHKQPHNAQSPDDVKHITSFIRNYAEEHAISLPGRIPGYKDYKFQLLSSSTTKHAIHNSYRAAALATTHKVVAYSTFCGIWNKYLPNIVVAKPRTDVCWQCMKNNNRIQRGQNISEELKTEVK